MARPVPPVRVAMPPASTLSVPGTICAFTWAMPLWMSVSGRSPVNSNRRS
jgi:hypothetical protein